MGKETYFHMPEGGSGGVETGINKAGIGNVATLEKSQTPQGPRLFQEGSSGVSSGPGGSVEGGSGLGSGPGGSPSGGNEGAGVSGSTHEGQTSTPEIEIEPGVQDMQDAFARRYGTNPYSEQPATPGEQDAGTENVISSEEDATPSQERATMQPEQALGHDPSEHLGDAHQRSLEDQVHEDAAVHEATEALRHDNTPENRRKLYAAIKHKVSHSLHHIPHKMHDLRHSLTPENIVKKSAKAAALTSLVSLVIILGIMKSFKNVS